MPEYKAPGVYVEEVERGPKPIEGVSTSVAGFLGQTERGPEKPRLVTSFADFRRVYGGVFDNSNLAYAVKGFFDNGGSRCYVGRITAAEASANAVLPGHSPESNTLGIQPSVLDFGKEPVGSTETRTVTLTNLGEAAAEDQEITISDLSVTGDTNYFKRQTELPQENGNRSVTLAPEETFDVRIELNLDTGSGDAGDKNGTLEVTHDAGSPSSPATVELTGTGVSAGDGVLSVSTGEIDFGPVPLGSEPTRTVTLTNLGDQSASDSDIDVTLTEFTGSDTDQFEVDPEITSESSDKRTIGPGESMDFEVAADPEDTGGKSATLKMQHSASTPGSPIEIPLSAEAREASLTAEAVGPGPWGEGVAVVVDDAALYKQDQNDLFKLTLRYWSDASARAAAEQSDAQYEDESEVPDPDVEEVYDNLSPDPASDNYFVGEVDSASNLVDLKAGAADRPPNSVTWLTHTASPDAKSEVGITHYQGTETPADERTGLAAFDEVDEITILCAPDENKHGDQLRTELLTHCRDRKDRMTILQASEDAKNPGSIRPPVDSSYAAFYYPWVTVTDPDTGNKTTVPPGGHIAGIYARTDAEQGVHKAPANITLNGVLSLPVNITKADQETLNPRGVNCIRSFRGRGIRVWGARTTSSDPSWKYVNVRRLFMYIEESIDEGTQWVVFENNTEELWARVRQTISNFLTVLWEDGALMGSTPEEAFYVKCDRTTMTQNDIDNGRLICEIGVAPVKPAEFVVFRISQWTEGVEGGG